MKRILIGTLASLALLGCSKSASVNLVLNSNDSASAALGTGTTTASLTTASATLPDGGTTDDDLTTVKSVTVTINEIDAHVADSSGAKEVDEHTGEVDGSKVEDNDGKWQTLSSTPRTLDLMTLRNGITQSLGITQLPDGKITQIRLKLKTDSMGADGKDLIAGAVVSSSGATCDLYVPHSATNPGVKLEGVFKAQTLTAGDQHLLEVNLKLKDSQIDTTSATCAYFLNPVIEIEKFENEGPEGSDPTDGASDHADGGN